MHIITSMCMSSQKCPFYGGLGTPSNTQFLGLHKPASQMTSQLVQPFWQETVGHMVVTIRVEINMQTMPLHL